MPSAWKFPWWWLPADLCQPELERFCFRGRNGLDDAERAEVLYDVYAANVYQNGNGEDEQGRVLHRMFDQVIIENVSFK